MPAVRAISIWGGNAAVTGATKAAPKDSRILSLLREWVAAERGYQALVTRLTRRPTTGLGQVQLEPADILGRRRVRD